MWVKEPEEPRRETYSCRFQHGDGNQKEKETVEWAQHEEMVPDSPIKI